MALPTLTKTWEISESYASSLPKNDSMGWTNYRNFWIQFVTYLKSKGWTVRAASTGTSASTSYDWTSPTHINWSNNAGMSNGQRSWIILRNPAIASTFDICIDMSSGGGYAESQEFQFCVSPGVYNLATIASSGRPATTSSDEILVTDQSHYTHGGVMGYRADAAWRMHCWSSTDRECTRILIYVNDNLTGLFMVDKVQNPTTGWANPFYATFAVGGGAGITLQSGWSSNSFIKTKIGSTNGVGLHTSCESITGQSALLSGQKNDVTGEMPVLPIGLVSTTSPVRGHHGNIFDAWFVPMTVNGSLYPDSTSKIFSVHGGLLLPWGSDKGLVKTR